MSGTNDEKKYLHTVELDVENSDEKQQDYLQGLEMMNLDYIEDMLLNLPDDIHVKDNSLSVQLEDPKEIIHPHISEYADISEEIVQIASVGNKEEAEELYLETIQDQIFTKSLAEKQNTAKPRMHINKKYVRYTQLGVVFVVMLVMFFATDQILTAPLRIFGQGLGSRVVFLLGTLVVCCAASMLWEKLRTELTEHRVAQTGIQFMTICGLYAYSSYILFATNVATEETLRPLFVQMALFILVVYVQEILFKQKELQIEKSMLSDYLNAPVFTTVIKEKGNVVELLTEDISVGQNIYIPKDSVVPLDCRIIEGKTIVQEVSISNKAQQKVGEVGTLLYSGYRNIGEDVIAKVLQGYESSFLVQAQYAAKTFKKKYKAFMRQMQKNIYFNCMIISLLAIFISVYCILLEQTFIEILGYNLLVWMVAYPSITAKEIWLTYRALQVTEITNGHIIKNPLKINASVQVSFQELQQSQIHHTEELVLEKVTSKVTIFSNRDIMKIIGGIATQINNPVTTAIMQVITKENIPILTAEQVVCVQGNTITAQIGTKSFMIKEMPRKPQQPICFEVLLEGFTIGKFSMRISNDVDNTDTQFIASTPKGYVAIHPCGILALHKDFLKVANVNQQRMHFKTTTIDAIQNVEADTPCLLLQSSTKNMEQVDVFCLEDSAIELQHLETLVVAIEKNNQHIQIRGIAYQIILVLLVSLAVFIWKIEAVAFMASIISLFGICFELALLGPPKSGNKRIIQKK